MSRSNGQPGIHVHWFLPTSGDSRDVVGFGPTSGRRAPDIDYLTLVARTAEQLGFEAVLTPTGTWCEDAWLTTGRAHRGDQAAEVPRGVPAGTRVADARRTTSIDVPADLAWASVARRRDWW